MNSERRRALGRSFAVLALATVLVAGCAGFRRGPLPEGDDGDDGDDGAAGSAGGGGNAGGSDTTIGFEDEAHAILLARCMECHVSGGRGAGSGFLLTGDPAQDLDSALFFVEPGSPAGSTLLRAASGRGHSAGAVLGEDSEEYQALSAWIAAGAMR
jgi:hypothetical protein